MTLTDTRTHADTRGPQVGLSVCAGGGAMPEGSAIISSDGSMSEESPRLSTASCNSNENAPAATPSDLPSLDPRSVSLISTPSSQSSQTSNNNPDPSPTGHGGEGSCPPRHSKGWSLGLAHSNNNNNKELQASRASRGRKETSPFMTGSMTPNPKPTYLDRVVMEIIETERMYVRDLRMIVEDYLAHIIDSSDLSIRPEQVCSLFGNIEDIYEFNSELLQALDLCDHDPVRVARCFVMKSEYFEIYTQYCTNYPNSVAALTDCMRIKSLAKFFRERQALLKRSLPLGSYLLKPVQRILKYHLLLQEIAKHFDPEEEGYEVVEEAIYTMTGVAWYINDMKRKHEHAVRLQEVQSLLLNWKGPDLTTYGELVLEGTFKVHRAKNERTLFLFDRVLLITKRRGEHYVYKTHISCSTLMLIENAKDSLSFSVTHYKHPKQPHTVQAKTVEEKKLWAHQIKRIILENHQAIIPQKAKDAILEMDSIYPPRYRYSPDRRRKAASSQWKDGGRGRHESEPKNQVLKSVVRDILQVGSDVSSLDLDKEQGRPPENEGGAEAASEQSPTDETSEPGLTETTEPDLLSLEPPAISVSPQSLEELKSEGDPAQTEEPLSATPDSDSRTLSSAESSEDEEEEEEEEDKELSDKEEEATSILPSSVLDKASSIAQHFTNSIKRGSTAPDRTLGCVSPRLPSRTGSSISLSAEPVDRPLRFSSVGSDPAENLAATDLTLSSPQDDGLFEADRSIQRRRDSILSKQDQLLIGKIKSYYENAESQDATFSLQRRESLTYIPTGLVRSSVSRLDSIPKDDHVQMNPSPSSTSSRLDPSSLELHSVLPTDPGGHSLDSSDQRSLAFEEGLRSQRVTSEEEFRPSSEMIKIWQTMEREITRGRQAPRTSRETDAVTKIGKTCEPESEASDLRTVPEQLTSPSTLKQKSSDVSRMGGLKGLREEAVVLRAPVLQVSELRTGAELPCQDSSDNTDQSKSKVLHLARQYSQRIKTTKPVLRQRSQGVLISKKSLPCVLEETEGSGKSDLTLVAQPKASSLQIGPTHQSQPPTSTLTVSSSMFSGGLASSRSHLTPPLPPVEGFNWPDVRELRSKYTDQKTPVARSHSIPEQMFDGGVRRRSSCSSSPFFTEGASCESLSYKTRCSQDASRRERSKRLHRAHSLDPQVSGTQMTELQQLNVAADGYYIAAETTLPNDPEHKITVIQKLPEPEDAASSLKEVEEESYVQIRSPTSREKISIMAVIDRCRAYQESDEYRQREEGKGQTESATASSTNLEEESDKTNVGHLSIVKNLREKFQSLS